MAQVFASLLHLDLANLAQEVKCLEEIGIDGIHVDIMDGVFVPNITFGPHIIKAIRRHTKLPIHCHMMIANPHKYAVDFVGVDSDLVIFHIEATAHADQLAREIRSYGKGVGIALNPATSDKNIEYLYDIVDQVLVMTVNPGAMIQKFQDDYIKKIKQISQSLMKHECVELGVYGDIKIENIESLTDAGVHHLVVGNALVRGTKSLRGSERQSAMKNNVKEIKEKITVIHDTNISITDDTESTEMNGCKTTE